MAIVIGQIEPLKKLKAIFKARGIHRFNSIGDIKNFLNNYEAEKGGVPDQAKALLEKEIEGLEKQLHQVIVKSKNNIFTEIFYFIKVKSLSRKRKYHRENYDKILESKIQKLHIELDFIKDTVDEVSPIIAGAIGENLTVKKLENLSDEYYLINDFSVKFNPPIYNRKEADRIFSIQIDHLLICKAGVFLLETKNWSKSSVERLDLRSPVAQVSRASYALFVLLNGDSKLNIVRHHWGSAKIPIKSVIVMTNHKPNEQFKYMKVLTLNELNGYIQYFDDVFSSDEVEHIFNYLVKLTK